MPTRILFASRFPEVILEIARSMTPPGFELRVADPGTPEFYEAAQDAEYYLGLVRQMGSEFFRAAPRLRLVQLRFHGVLGPAAGWRSAVIPGRPDAVEEGPTAAGPPGGAVARGVGIAA